MKRINPNLLTEEEILETIKEEYYKIQPKECWEFFKKKERSPSLPYIKKRFNMTYNEILLHAGVCESDIKFISSRIRGKEYYLEGLKKLAEKLGKTPTVEEYINAGYSLDMLRKYYGSYSNALNLIGLEANFEFKAKNMSKEELVEIYKEISSNIGSPATIREIQKYCSKCGVQIFYRYFTSMNTLRKEAGFSDSAYGRLLYSKEQIKDILIKEYCRTGKRLTTKEIRKRKDLPAVNTILNYFKANSWEMVWREIEGELNTSDRLN